MVGLRQVCGLLLLGVSLIMVSCRQAEEWVTAVAPPQTPLPPHIYLPIALAQGAATPTPRPASTATPSPPCTQPGEIVTNSLASQWAGTLNYRIYYPPCYGENGRVYPTLYLLPGNIHTDSIWQDLGLQQVADTMMLRNNGPSILIVMADGGWIAQNTSGGPGSYESVILQELIPHVEATTCAWADPQGRAIGGLSRGGYWALEIAFRHPNEFAGVGGHSAALVDSYAGPDLNPRNTALTQELGSLQIYLDIGRSDYLLPPLLTLHEEMTAQQIAHTWVLQDGAHEETYWATHLPDYLRWYTALWQAAQLLRPRCAP